MSPNFSTNLYGKYGNLGEIEAIPFSDHLPDFENIRHFDDKVSPATWVIRDEYTLLWFFFLRSAKVKKYGTLNFFLAQNHLGLEMSKRYSYSSHREIAYHRGIQAITYLDNKPSF